MYTMSTYTMHTAKRDVLMSSLVWQYASSQPGWPLDAPIPSYTGHWLFHHPLGMTITALRITATFLPFKGSRNNFFLTGSTDRWRDRIFCTLQGNIAGVCGIDCTLGARGTVDFPTTATAAGSGTSILLAVARKVSAHRLLSIPVKTPVVAEVYRYVLLVLAACCIQFRCSHHERVSEHKTA